MTDGLDLLLLGGYLLVLVAIGAWSARRTRTPRDFFLAGQRLGLVVTAVATMSAAFSGFVFLGGPGLMYRDGVRALFICIPIGVTPALLGWLVAVRLRLYAEAPDVLTLPDVVARRYRSRAAAAGAAATILAGCIGYLAAQLLALGVLLQVLLGWNLATGVWAGLLVILTYSVAGGMVAGAWTDFAQGLLMLAAATAVSVMVFASDGGIGGLSRSIAGSEAFGEGFFVPFGDSAVAAASFFLVFSIGALAQPQILHKIMMVRDLDRLRWLPLALGGSQLACLAVWLGFGLLVPAAVASKLMPPMGTFDGAVPTFLSTVAPEAVSGLVLVAIVAAIMSSADSFLNLAAGALCRDLPRALGTAGGSVDDHTQVRRLRWTTLAVGLAAGALAVGYRDLIALLGTFAFGIFAAGLVPALVVGLGWRRASSRAAVGSMAVGVIAAVGVDLIRRRAPELWTGWGLPEGLVPAAPALCLSIVVFVLLSWLDRRPRRLDPLAERILDL